MQLLVTNNLYAQAVAPFNYLPLLKLLSLLKPWRTVVATLFVLLSEKGTGFTIHKVRE